MIDQNGEHRVNVEPLKIARLSLKICLRGNGPLWMVSLVGRDDTAINGVDKKNRSKNGFAFDFLPAGYHPPRRKVTVHSPPELPVFPAKAGIHTRRWLIIIMRIGIVSVLAETLDSRFRRNDDQTGGAERLR